MKLYYSKGACSLSVHIALEELGLPYEAVAVDIMRGPSPEFMKLNPMGAVPVLQLDDGQVLTEAAVVLQYVADRKPEANLAPRAGTMERYRLQETMNFIATEIHKGFGPLWALDHFTKDPAARAEVREFVASDLDFKFGLLDQRLADRQWLMPWGYTIADAYLFTILNWTYFHKLDLAKHPKLTDYMARVKARPAVTKALKAEHLMS
jgi:glutathione S-transferase